MKFTLEYIEIEPLSSYGYKKTKVKFNIWLFPYTLDLNVNLESFKRSHEAVLRNEVPTAIKFGSFWRGLKIHFRTEEGIFFVGSITTWVIPVMYRCEYVHYFNRAGVKNLVEYISNNT